MKKSDVTIDAHGREINLRFDVLNNYMEDGKPSDRDWETIFQRT